MVIHGPHAAQLGEPSELALGTPQLLQISIASIMVYLVGTASCRARRLGRREREGHYYVSCRLLMNKPPYLFRTTSSYERFVHQLFTLITRKGQVKLLWFISLYYQTLQVPGTSHNPYAPSISSRLLTATSTTTLPPIIHPKVAIWSPPAWPETQRTSPQGLRQWSWCKSSRPPNFQSPKLPVEP